MAMDSERTIRYLNTMLGEMQASVEAVDVDQYRNALQDVTKRLSESHSQEQLNEVTGGAGAWDGRGKQHWQ